MIAFLALLAFLAITLTLAAIGAARGHLTLIIRRRPQPRPRPENKP